MQRKVGINGFGRIGRAIFRILLEKKLFDVVVINDINPDIKNIAYQLKYDSLYDTLKYEVKTKYDLLIVDGKEIKVYNEKNIDRVPWHEHGITRVIDASGVYHNLDLSRNLKDKGIKQVIVTHSPSEEKLDKSVIMGINEKDIDIKNDFIISSSICDANAFAHVADVLEKNYGIDHGFLTTLHPWLSYQNLSDGPSTSWSVPGNINAHYVVGRATMPSVLPKPTSAISATCKVLKSLKDKVYSFSYRVPTAIVSSADLSLKLKKKVKVEEIQKLFKDKAEKQKHNIILNNYDPLVSIDFKGCDYSVVVDHRWTAVMADNFIKMILWYDNEWGYSARVVDIVDYLFNNDTSLTTK